MQVINKTASVIFELIRLIILSYNRCVEKNIKRCKIIDCPHIQFIVMLTSLLCEKRSIINRVHISVIFRLAKFTTLYYKAIPN